MPPLPLWARALRGLDRAAWNAYRAHEIIRDELLFAWLPPDQRSLLTVAAYSDLRAYLPGGSIFEGGLRSWEERLLANPHIPQKGRVLVAAAGGGREVKALLERGYSVTAFEPNPVLFEGARRVAASSASAQIVSANYEDLVSAADSRGPLAVLREQSFDWVLFGWGSFTHLTERDTQRDVLRAARAIAPRAPLALSFFLRAPEVDSRSKRLRLLLRTALSRVGGRPKFEDGLGYTYVGGFVYSFTRAELSELAAQARYEIAAYDDDVFPWALLLPT